MYDSNNFGISDDYEYHEILIDSRDALTQYSSSYTSLNWPKITLGKELERVAAVKVLQVIIPKTWYNVTSDNGTFGYFTYFNNSVRWANPVTPGSLTLTPGAYTRTELNTEVQSKLLTKQTSWTVTANPAQSKSTWYYSASTNVNRTWMFTFNPTSTFNLTPTVANQTFAAAYQNNGRFNPRRVLGWEGDAGFPTSTTTLLSSSNGIAVYPSNNVRGYLIASKSFQTPYAEELNPTSIYLNSKTLGSMINNIHLNGNSHMVPPNTGGDEEQICSIPVPSTIEKGENIVYSDPDPQKWFKFGGNLSFPTSFDFYLTSGVNVVPLDLNGSSFIVKLGVLTNKREFERTFPTSTSSGYSRVRNLIVTK